MTNGKENNPKKFRQKESHLQPAFFKAIHGFVESLVNQSNNLAGKAQETTIFNKFVHKIKNIFKVADPKLEVKKEDSKLAGRIRELNKNASEVLKVLNTVREDLKNEVDNELYTFVESVMNPMIRDVERVQKIVKTEGALHHKMDAFNKYNKWIDKAKMWVQICSTAKNKNAISQAVVNHTISDFVALIDRDLQLIEDYQEHLLDDIEVSEDEKNILRDEIIYGLKPHVKRMMALKNHPKGITLENLNHWKDNADKRRERYFDAILHLIDSKVNEANPSKVDNKEEHGILIGTLEQISYLEMEIPLLAEKIEANPVDPFEIEVSMQQLQALEDEVRDLYLDMRMPPAVIERLQHLKELLAKTFSKIKNNSQ